MIAKDAAKVLEASGIESITMPFVRALLVNASVSPSAFIYIDIYIYKRFQMFLVYDGIEDSESSQDL